MLNSKLCVLIIENEYLIAMDAERILSEALSCEVVIATLKNYREAMQDQKFDVVLLDLGETPAPNAGDFATICESGAKLVFTTAGDIYADGVPGFAENPIVLKPYDEAQLIAAINSAQSRPR